MKKILPFFFMSFSSGIFAQVNFSMPPEANNFYDNAMQKIKPALKNIISKNAQNLKGRHVNMDSLFAQLQKEAALRNNNNETLQAITVLIMVQVSKNADADLKNLVINMPKNKTGDAGNDTRENKVADILANKSQIAENVSIAMKKITPTQEIVLDNLK
jgi:hypothetical protein